MGETTGWCGGVCGGIIKQSNKLTLWQVNCSGEVLAKGRRPGWNLLHIAGDLIDRPATRVTESAKSLPRKGRRWTAAAAARPAAKVSCS